MIERADKYTVYNIFDKEANFWYFIPKYQREYTWKYAEWEALYDDISDNDEGYFIGSIICINHGDSINPVLEVIDGQQRLTTIALFLTAIYKRLKALESYIEEDDRDILPTLVKSLKRKKSETGCILIPQIQNYNRDDFNYIMSVNNIRPIADVKKPYFGNRKISRCFEYFLIRLDQELEGHDEHVQVYILLNKYNKLKKALLVKMEVSSHADAYVLFESLNNRGAQLTAIDLMKNSIMAKAEKAGLTVDECFTKWQELLGFLGDDYNTQERFFRHFYNAFKNRLNEPFRKDDDRKKEPLGTIATKSNLLSIYEKLINKDLSLFLEDILKAGERYSWLLAPAKNKDNLNYAEALIDLNHIQGVPSYIILLYLIYNQKKLEVSDKTIESIITLLVKFFVRRNATDFPSTRDIPRLFMSVIAQIEEEDLKGNAIYSLLLSRLKDVSSSDEAFQKALSGDIYKTNVDVARFVLCSLAELGMSTETWTDLWARNSKSGNYIWTIEHIFPEGENIPSEWIDMIANGDAELARKYLYEYSHKLGNLTMTGYNSTLGNFSFEKKRDRVSKKDPSVYIGYKNGLSINGELAEKENWTIEDIIARTEKLSQQAISLFAFPD